jgi:NhaP-type Na+/H+ or K+/H+ antiporter
MAIASSIVDRLPMTAGLAYLVIGVLIGPQGSRLIDVDLLANARLIEHVTEVALLFSLFSAGLKLRVALYEARWQAPVRLATAGVALTVVLIAGLAMVMLQLPLYVALLVAAIVAPTDPVLASEVQVTHPDDRDRVRLTLTGEAGLNDGTAFPFVLLGLALVGAHELGAFGWRWLLKDVLWASGVGLATGWGLGWSVARLVVYMRREHDQAHGVDDFVALGLIAASYGIALSLHGYGFLAVFAAGLSMRHLETETQPMEKHALPEGGVDDHSESERGAVQDLTKKVLSFNLQMERIGEVAVVIVLGALLQWTMLSGIVLLFALVTFLVVRPIVVTLSLWGTRLSTTQAALISWFGVRGAGSVFYLAYAIGHGLEASHAAVVASVVLPTVALSVVVHGVSVTPFMLAYSRRRGNRPQHA